MTNDTMTKDEARDLLRTAKLNPCFTAGMLGGQTIAGILLGIRHPVAGVSILASAGSDLTSGFVCGCKAMNLHYQDRLIELEKRRVKRSISRIPEDEQAELLPHLQPAAVAGL